MSAIKWLKAQTTISMKLDNVSAKSIHKSSKSTRISKLMDWHCCSIISVIFNAYWWVYCHSIFRFSTVFITIVLQYSIDCRAMTRTLLELDKKLWLVFKLYDVEGFSLNRNKYCKCYRIIFYHYSILKGILYWNSFKINHNCLHLKICFIWT